MSTVNLSPNLIRASLYITRANGNHALNTNTSKVQTVQTRNGVDDGLLMIGIFCFMVPTMFLSAALGLKYLEISDLIANGLYISAAALTARIATAYLIKYMAAEKNRSEVTWMIIAMFAPAVSLIALSISGTKIKPITSTAPTSQKAVKATIKNYHVAREIQMPRTSQAI